LEPDPAEAQAPINKYVVEHMLQLPNLDYDAIVTVSRIGCGQDRAILYEVVTVFFVPGCSRK